MDHHPKFEHSRFIGDKRTQLVYDLDSWDDEAIINEIVAEGVGLSFGPDTLAEARNRGYTLATPGVRRRHRTVPRDDQHVSGEPCGRASRDRATSGRRHPVSG